MRSMLAHWLIFNVNMTCFALCDGKNTAYQKYVKVFTTFIGGFSWEECAVTRGTFNRTALIRAEPVTFRVVTKHQYAGGNNAVCRTPKLCGIIRKMRFSTAAPEGLRKNPGYPPRQNFRILRVSRPFFHKIVYLGWLHIYYMMLTPKSILMATFSENFENFKKWLVFFPWSLKSPYSTLSPQKFSKIYAENADTIIPLQYAIQLTWTNLISLSE